GCSLMVVTGIFVVNFGVSKFTNSLGSDGSGRMPVRAPNILEPQQHLNKEVNQGDMGITNRYPRLPRRPDNDNQNPFVTKYLSADPMDKILIFQQNTII
ncbi:MAG: hypothetical protein EZS28_023905, partial [Streblomastix strix]